MFQAGTDFPLWRRRGRNFYRQIWHCEQTFYIPEDYVQQTRHYGPYTGALHARDAVLQSSNPTETNLTFLPPFYFEVIG
jgi:hypothetical protein